MLPERSAERSVALHRERSWELVDAPVEEIDVEEMFMEVEDNSAWTEVSTRAKRLRRGVTDETNVEVLGKEMQELEHTRQDKREDGENESGRDNGNRIRKAEQNNDEVEEGDNKKEHDHRKRYFDDKDRRPLCAEANIIL